MSTDFLENPEWIIQLEEYLQKVRPSIEIRPKLDIGYKIDGQTIIIHEIRPKWNKPNEIIEPEVAKTIYVKSKDHWKVYWLRGNLKWYRYDPNPTVPDLKSFLNLVEEDAFGCFWG